ncbi:MAG: sugar ABC transporter ATP-binding protein [Burkholderiaceae bacterium]|nr:sugar ABC transporter ATP-binding protein [Burkholderiaceae bacterium]
MLLELRGIKKSFGATHALAGIDFSLEKGQIHAVCGENGAGKSTLMKVIDGILQPDAGQLLVEGSPLRIKDPGHAAELGISLVHQEISLCGCATVAENIFMCEVNQSKRLLMDYAALQVRAQQIIQRLGKDIDTATLVENLSLSNQQLVEIAKALALDCKILILDEPTAALTEVESESLFKILHELANAGIGIIYISHRMAEIFEHCSHVTVLRDGASVFTGKIQDTNADELIKKMVGRGLGAYYPEKSQTIGTRPLLEVTAISDADRVHGVSLQIMPGEILGIAGLMGAGRSEIAKVICGITPQCSGTVTMNGTPVDTRTYQKALAHGIAYLSEDRKSEGVFLELPIQSNIASMALARVQSKFFTVDPVKEAEQAQRLGQKLKLKASSVAANADSLSGGNQQKVAIAKLLATNPKIVFMDEPTRGVDVGAKAEIHQVLRLLCNEGVGVVVISSELPEIIGLCDRTIVIRNGSVAGELRAEATTEESILRMASGLKQESEQ